MQRAGYLLMLVSLLATPAFADVPDEQAFILRSLRPSEAATVQAATGGLEKLPLLEAEVHLDLDKRRVDGNAILGWTNNTGQPVTKVPIRFSSNSGGRKAPHAGWTHVTVTMPGASPVTVKVHQQSKTISIIPLPRPLQPGERVVLGGKLDGRLALIPRGATDPVMASMSTLVSGSAPQPAGDQYGTFACGDDICTLTGFTPEVPAFIDGQFDTHEGSGIGDATYSEPQNLVLTVIAPHGVGLAVTGVEIGHIPEKNGLDRWTFAMAATREVGVVASETFVTDEATVDGVQVRSFSRKSDHEAGKRALDSAASALHVLDTAFGPYPWAVLNIAESALVGGAGGVELPGLALGASGFYQSGGGLLGSLGAGADLSGDMLDFITRHEVAHQWWHAQVGSHSQLHPYIDEPLAQWSALYTVQKAEGADAAQRMRELQVAANFQALSVLGIPDGIVARPAGAFSSMLEYAGLVYGKAPLFYEAAAKLIGEDALLGALRSVTADYRFKRVTPEQLRRALVRSADAQGPEMAALWKRWFEEEHGEEDVGSLDLGSLAGMLGLGQLPGNQEDAADAFKLFQQFMQQMGDDQ